MRNSRARDPELDLLPTLDREWFTSQAVRWSERVEGQEIHGRSMVMGLRCGPAGLILDMLLHEMAHLIEIDDARAHRFRYGLRFEGADVSLMPTERECRVAGIQNVLRLALGLEMQPWTALVSAFKVLPGFYLVPGEDDDQRLLWCAGEAQKEAGRWTPDAVRREWKRKVALVEARGAG